MQGSPVGSLQAVYGRRIKRVTLQRTLVSLLMFEPERVTYKHIVVLFDNMLWLQDKSLKDPDFKEKFGVTLKVLAYILKNLNLRADRISEAQIRKLSEKFLRNLKHFGLEQRNYKNPLKQQWSYVEVRRSQPTGVSKKELAPARYIGVGYRDKGTAKQPWLDGSPSWQEVASTTIKELSR